MAEEKKVPDDVAGVDTAATLMQDDFSLDDDDDDDIGYAEPLRDNADSSNNPPCYMPQAGDNIPSDDHLKPMNAVGPYATGKVDWSPLGGLTGTRPVVDRYSITRFSPNEWRARNNDVINSVLKNFEDEEQNKYRCNTSCERITRLVNQTQDDTNDCLRLRSHTMNKWKRMLEDAIKAMSDEVSTMEVERIRLKKSLVILGVPESIAKECIELRTGRPDTELVRDKVEEELIIELALISEIRMLLKKTLEDFEAQQVENRTARERLEFDWSDKLQSTMIDTHNLSLTNESKIIMFRPGAIRQPPEQSTEVYWEHFSRESLESCEQCRQRSIELRQTLNAILTNAARDIRSQADIVEQCFISRINCTQEVLTRFENELRNCLSRLAETERRIDDLQESIRKFDNGMKVAQTRMDNRNMRPNVENCRDAPQKALIDEVKVIHSSVTNMLQELDSAEKCKTDLMNLRGTLEREIMLKRRTILLDRERCMRLRSFYPSADTLTNIAI
ncbi:tektin-1 [Teleopsis dalmanni]|uniref:tektin-1 n=1 Tax=Teleopsis dalmanni TaxID=139649 RepID=UPI0018CF4537|nr:tektin-1 [Teleopsis dalmanni]